MNPNPSDGNGALEAGCFPRGVPACVDTASLERGELERGELERGELERGELERGELERGELERGELEPCAGDAFSFAKAGCAGGDGRSSAILASGGGSSPLA